MPYLPIQDHGLIGNMHTAVLVGLNGSIDWLCLPHFDSPSVFAAILDDEKGGFFQIFPRDTEGLTCKQMYWPETNVTITRFLHPTGVVEVIDYMPVNLRPDQIGFGWLTRRVEAVRGSTPLMLTCAPAFNYALDKHQIDLHHGAALFRSDRLTLELITCDCLALSEQNGAVVADLNLKQGQVSSFILRVAGKEQPGPAVSPELETTLFNQTINYWHNWLSKCTYTGRWREMVHRSALLLKLLTFAPTGAIVASPTCSLPEAIPGSRNWDYRYTWIRDAAFSIYALMRLGFDEEAGAFMNFLAKRCHERQPDGGLQVMYGLRGEHELPETTLDHLKGYKSCQPVRVGNAAANQLQLDIYGELMDSIYLYNKYGAPISWELWVEIAALIEWVCQHWRDPDDGIWETRGGRQQFVYSKLMCWVALDRAIRLADKRSFPADRPKWNKVRDEIYLDLMQHGWSETHHAFVQYYGSDALDASALMMPLVFFMAPNDPRMLQTLDAICKDPAEGGLLSNSLVFRYNASQFNDGLDGKEGTFNMCTFWLVEALTRAGATDRPKLDQARLIFEKMLGYANHLGLFSEEVGAHGGALGNFPQAFTHLGLISAAFNLDRTLGQRGW